MTLQKLREAIKAKTLTMGQRSVLKKIKLGQAKVVFLSKDCKKEVEQSMQHYAKVSTIEVIQLDVNAKEVGILCKKQFAISLLCY